ncbi:ABC transporter permease subunit [Bacillus timonensis]|nr:ABC transporter permease subunit [Bacillus timonensis]
MKLFRKNSVFLLLLPAFIFTICFVGYGICMAIIESLKGANVLTLTHYESLFSNESFLASLCYSLYIAFVATILSLGIGLVFTRVMYEYLQKQSSKILVWIPMLFPHFVWAYMVILLFSQSGWLSSATFQAGLIHDLSQFPIIVNDRFGFGIIITYVWKELPFVILMLLPVYVQLNAELPQVVKTLGGNEWHVFKTAEWPWVLPVLVEVGIIVFAFILSAYEVPYLLGTTYPKMISILAYQWFFEGDWSNRPLSFAAMVVITSAVVSLLCFYLLLMNKKRYRLMKGNIK